MTNQDKQQAIDLLRLMVPERRERLADIDPRLADYYDHLCEHSGTEKGDANDLHNGYELLCALRLLRLLDTYPLNREKIDQVIFMCCGRSLQDVHDMISEVSKTSYIEGVHAEQAISAKFGGRIK